MLRTGKASAISAGSIKLSVASQATLPKLADPARKTKMVRDPIAGLRGLLSRIALVAPNPASIPLRSIGGDSEAMASRWRNSPETK